MVGVLLLLGIELNPNHLLVFEYRFDGWLGDELLTSHPYFIITEQLSLLMEPAKLSGYDLAEVIISKSEIFEDLYLFRILPAFVWLKVDGHAGRDDFGISSSKTLIVSGRALSRLQLASLQHCIINVYQE